MNTRTLAIIGALGCAAIFVLLFTQGSQRKAMRRVKRAKGGPPEGRPRISDALSYLPDVIPQVVGSGDGLGDAARPRYVSAMEADRIRMIAQGFTEEEAAAVVGGKVYGMAMVPYPEDVA